MSTYTLLFTGGFFYFFQSYPLYNQDSLIYLRALMYIVKNESFRVVCCLREEKFFTLILFAVILGGGGGGSAPPGSGAWVAGGSVARGAVQSRRRAAVQSRRGAVAGAVQTAEQARGHGGL